MKTTLLLRLLLLSLCLLRGFKVSLSSAALGGG